MLRFTGLALFICALSAPVTADPQKALLGMSIDEAQKTPFFLFFHLSKTNEFADPVHKGVKTTVFGVRGQFKGAVNLLVSTRKGSDRIFDADLMLRRDFVDGPTNPFARDVTKSFLELFPGIERPEVAALHSSIWKGCTANT